MRAYLILKKQLCRSTDAINVLHLPVEMYTTVVYCCDNFVASSCLPCCVLPNKECVRYKQQQVSWGEKGFRTSLVVGCPSLVVPQRGSLTTRRELIFSNTVVGFYNGLAICDIRAHLLTVISIA